MVTATSERESPLFEHQNTCLRQPRARTHPCADGEGDELARFGGGSGAVGPRGRLLLKPALRAEERWELPPAFVAAKGEVVCIDDRAFRHTIAQNRRVADGLAGQQQRRFDTQHLLEQGLNVSRRLGRRLRARRMRPW